MAGKSVSLVQYLRNYNINRTANILELNLEIWHLSERIRRLHFDRDLLLTQTREFLTLLFDKLALEASLETVQNPNLDFQVVKIILNRTKAVSRYFDSDSFDLTNRSTAILSPKAMKGSKKTVCPSLWIHQIFLSSNHARKHLVKLQTEHLKLHKSSYAIKQLLLRFDEDNALLRQDIALLQDSSTRDLKRAAETWNRLASVELCLLSDAEKRRSIASQRRMSALRIRRMSMTSGSQPPTDQLPFPSLRDDGSTSRRASVLGRSFSTTERRSERAGENDAITSPSRYRLSQRSLGSRRGSYVRDPTDNLTKRMSIVSLGKRSGAVLTDWTWDGADSGDEQQSSADRSMESSDLTSQSVAAQGSVETAETSVSDDGDATNENAPLKATDSEPKTNTSKSTSSNISVNASVDTSACGQATSTKECIPGLSSLGKSGGRPRSYIAPKHRYSMYDHLGRRQAPASIEAVQADAERMYGTGSAA